MQKYIVLLRGVNVGGKNLLPMKPLVALLEKNDFQEVSFYIQSGNLILNSACDPCEIIKQIICNNFGFTPVIFTLKASDFFTAFSHNPYKEFEGKFVHFYFCDKPIILNIDKIDHWISSTEKYYVEKNVFYLFAPEGVGRSKLVLNVESCLGQPGTGRNLNTINKIANLAS
jgi:uncharacterized protein (DUF1697 family)